MPCAACAKRLINLGNVRKIYYAREYRIRSSLELFSTVGIAVEHQPHQSIHDGEHACPC
jgi:deoxycytidylate deaminase